MTSDIQTATGSGRLTLRGTYGSPFTRKVRFAAEYLGLMSRIDVVIAKPSDEKDTIRKQNPLGKMPALVLPDGTAIYDSRVIVEFLQDLAGSKRLIPADGMARFRALTRIALADGLMDAGLMIVNEGRWRDPEHHVAKWLDYHRGKMLRALAEFEADLPDPTKTDAVCIGLSVALAYIDWRQQVDWRAQFPRLVEWFKRFEHIEPAFHRTDPPKTAD